ncbi:MAG: fibronectin type III domain-containing protein [Imperialibacter sp.]|uniref:fibronectin type III domain-containing protein n=1 Tax=Imperialibacter sp. TaxID=2038411 RepID=UPI003A89D28F
MKNYTAKSLATFFTISLIVYQNTWAQQAMITSISNITATTATVNWTHYGSPTPGYFQVIVSPGSTTYNVWSGTATSQNISGLGPNTNYSVQVVAWYNSGSYSIASPQYAFKTCLSTPLVPTNLYSSNITSTSFVANWTASTSCVDYYKVQVADYNNNIVGTYNTTSTSQLVSSLTCSNTSQYLYKFRVAAVFKGVQSSASYWQSVYIALQTPSTPWVLYGTQTSTSCTIFVNLPSCEVSQTKLYLYLNGSLVDGYPKYMENYSYGSRKVLAVTSLTPNTTYTAKAKNFHGPESPFSDELQFTTLPASGAFLLDQISDVPDVSMSVFPNPTSSEIRLKSSIETHGTKVFYLIMNQAGKVFIEGTSLLEAPICIEGLEKGIYFLKYKTENSEGIKRVVKF